MRVFAILWVMVNHIGSEGRLDVLERRPSAKLFKVESLTRKLMQITILA